MSLTDEELLAQISRERNRVRALVSRLYETKRPELLPYADRIWAKADAVDRELSNLALFIETLRAGV